MRVSWAMAMAVWLLAAASVAQLRDNRSTAKVGELNELRADFTVPEGHDLATQRWRIVYRSGKADGLAFDGGDVFVVTSATPGVVVHVIWEATFINWEDRKFSQSDRRYVITFENGGTPEDPADPPTDPDTTKVTRVTYVHERRDGIVPRPIQAALQKLNQQGIPASAIDKDARDGTGEVPDQYKVAIAKALEHRLPCLVVERSGGSVVATSVRTEQDVMEAIK